MYMFIMIILLMIIVYQSFQIRKHKINGYKLTKRVDYYEKENSEVLVGINCRHSVEKNIDGLFLINHEDSLARVECQPHITKYY